VNGFEVFSSDDVLPALDERGMKGALHPIPITQIPASA
jgi:hypothetical protein